MKLSDLEFAQHSNTCCFKRARVARSGFIVQGKMACPVLQSLYIHAKASVQPSCLCISCRAPSGHRATLTQPLPGAWPQLSVLHTSFCYSACFSPSFRQLPLHYSLEQGLDAMTTKLVPQSCRVPPRPVNSC